MPVQTLLLCVVAGWFVLALLLVATDRTLTWIEGARSRSKA